MAKYLIDNNINCDITKTHYSKRKDINSLKIEDIIKININKIITKI